MSQFEKTGKIIAEKTDTFLSGKPIWIWWASYILLTGVLFAIFYLAFYILSVQWWVLLLLSVIIGAIWGTIAFTNKKVVQK